jgi:predicted DNA-binding protein YlxM (UPF0122 family)
MIFSLENLKMTGNIFLNVINMSELQILGGYKENMRAGEAVLTKKKKKINYPDKINYPETRLPVAVSEDHPIDLSRALQMRFRNGMTYEMIGKQFNTTKQAVHAKLSRFVALLPDPEELEAYRTYKGDLFESAEMRLLESMMDEEKIKDASLNNSAYAFQQVANQTRLQHGQSTTIIDLITISATSKDLIENLREIERMRNEMKAIDVTPVKEKELKVE